MYIHQESNKNIKNNILKKSKNLFREHLIFNNLILLILINDFFYQIYYNLLYL